LVNETNEISEKQQQNYLKNMINSMKDLKITHTNYKQYTDVVRNQHEIIETMIQSLMYRYQKVQSQIDLKDKNEKISQMLKERVVPYEVYELHMERGTIVEDLVVWKGLQAEMLDTIFRKLIGALGAVKSLDIEREVTQGLKEMNTAYFGFMKEYVIDKSDEADRKISDFKNEINTRFDSLTHMMTSLVTTKIIEAQTNDRVVISGRETKDIHDLSKAPPIVESIKKPKVKVAEQLVAKSIDEGEEDNALSCTECDEKFENESQLSAHSMLMHQSRKKG
jgi:hypothetical protein